jgi:Protein of unknown function (DUF2274)
MATLKLGPIVDDKPVKTTLELSATVWRDLVDYVRRRTSTLCKRETSRMHHLRSVTTNFDQESQRPPVYGFGRWRQPAAKPDPMTKAG